jgi:hypothetical protein
MPVRRRLLLRVVLDWGMMLAAVPLAVSSGLLWLGFPWGYYPARLVWREVHKWSGLVFGLLALVHLALNFGWLLRATRKLLSRSAEPRPGEGEPSGES